MRLICFDVARDGCRAGISGGRDCISAFFVYPKAKTAKRKKKKGSARAGCSIGW
jgi:hypothetical protein